MTDARPACGSDLGTTFSASEVVVLVVEDGEQEARRIREALGRCRGFTFRALHVHCIADALPRLERGDVHLVLLDLCLPDGLGVSSLHRVQLRSPEVPVIVIVDSGDEESGAAAVRDGAQCYLTRSELDDRVLGHAIRNALERFHWNKTTTAEHLGLKRTTLQYKIKKYGLE